MDRTRYRLDTEVTYTPARQELSNPNKIKEKEQTNDTRSRKV